MIKNYLRNSSETSSYIQKIFFVNTPLSGGVG